MLEKLSNVAYGQSKKIYNTFLYSLMKIICIVNFIPGSEQKPPEQKSER